MLWIQVRHAIGHTRTWQRSRKSHGTPHDRISLGWWQCRLWSVFALPLKSYTFLVSQPLKVCLGLRDPDKFLSKRGLAGLGLRLVCFGFATLSRLEDLHVPLGFLEYLFPMIGSAC